MSDSAITPKSTHSEITSTRIDPAHHLPVNDAASDPTPWLALAGRDSSQTTEQLDRQTNELLAYVQRQNQEIDSRQAELNARLAQLDSELRAARLQSTQKTGDDLLAVGTTESNDMPIMDEVQARETLPEETNTAQVDPQSGSSELHEQDQESLEPSNLDQNARIRPSDFDDVEKVVAEIASVCGQQTSTSEYASDNLSDQPTMLNESMTTDAVPQEVDNPIDWESPVSVPFLRVQGPNQEVGRFGSNVDMGGMASSPAATTLESERRLLAERNIELDRRKLVLQRMQDETQSLHREALEMRMVTEQLWAELSEKTPADHLHQLLSTLRTRLDDQYATMNQTLSDRRAELVTCRSRMHEKQQELREQSRKLQEWVESRHDEVKSHAAQLDAREMLLNRREHRLQDEFAKWEAQQRAYKQQLNGLLRKISLAGLSDHRGP